ncbi:unnamed protein product [Orchesella dallaii]|uniref:Uncharacterized protein n=1 Tax=Orchesella dallaii TaxID=48710 RepID=A0ABP1S8H9_9HEXA
MSQGYLSYQELPYFSTICLFIFISAVDYKKSKSHPNILSFGIQILTRHPKSPAYSNSIALETVGELCETPPSSSSSPAQSSFGVLVTTPPPQPHSSEKAVVDEEKLKSAIASALFWHSHSITKNSTSSPFNFSSGRWFWVVIMCKIAVLALALVLILTFVLNGERGGAEASGGYRKPPFNGSIFGKRTSVVGSDGAGFPTATTGTAGGSRAYYNNFCEMAWETCFAQYLAESSR